MEDMSLDLPARPTTGVRASLRRFADAAVTPLDLDDVLDHFHPLRASSELRGRVVAVRPETTESATLVIKPGKGWRGHVPGQYLRVGVDVDGVRLWRTYSLTHGPRPDGHVSITVKGIPDGVVSNHLVHRTRPGTMLQLGQAEGEFVLPQPIPAKLLLVTGGSGITPVIGMLRNLFSRAVPPADRHRAAPLGAVARRGDLRPGDPVVRRPRPAAPDRAAHRRARPARRRRARRRSSPTSTSGSPSPAARSASSTRSRPTTPRATSRCTWSGSGSSFVEPGEGGAVTFTASGAVVEADGATPILDAAENAGVLMPSGCRMGICFGCVLPLREGAVRDLRNGEVTTAAPGDGVVVQTCISAAAGPCEIDH